MAVSRRQTVKGLKKRCQHLDWNRCDCPWYGSFLTVDKKNLDLWHGKPIPNRDYAATVFANFKDAIRAGTYSPRGQALHVDSGEVTFSSALDTYRSEHVGAERVEKRGAMVWRLTGKGLHDKGILYSLAILEHEFGAESLIALSKMSHLLWKQRLDAIGKRRHLTARSLNTYFKYVSGFFNWANGAELFGALRNPCAKNKVFRLDRKAEKKKREVRVPEAAEQKMIARCLEADDAALTVSGGAKRTTGREMLRRLYAAIDCGLRKEEMLLIKLKMVRFDVQYTLGNGTALNAIKIVLPASITKGGKSTGEDETVWVMTPRLARIIEGRRFIGPDGYVFGDEHGRRIKGFDHSWHHLFKAAGLVPGRGDGEHCWHDLRHEFASYLVEQGASGDEVMRLCRHRDYDTTLGYLSAQDSRLAERAALMANRKVGP